MKNSIFLLTLICAFITSCNNSTIKNNSNEHSIKVTDTQGNEVYLDSVAQRVVCVFDPSVDVVYMLQAQDKLVGITAETYHDDELYNYLKHIDPRVMNKELPTPGSNEMINIESVIALKPDLVIVKQLSPSAIATLNSMNIAVYLATSDSYSNLMKEMKDISILLGKEERGDQLIAYAKEKTQQLEERAKQYATNDKPKNAYFTWANGRIFSTAGRNSAMNNCLTLAGVENACPSDIDKPNINPETLISWNPDMIVMWNDSPDLFYNKKELASIKAIDQKQIYNLMPMFYYNPHTFKALCAAVAISNWAYLGNDEKALDETKEIILQLYGEETGSELVKHL